MAKGGGTALDTSVIVAALLERHEHHQVARLTVGAALDQGAVLPLPALLEAYSVLTRLPPPWRLRATDARALLDRTFRDRARVVNLDQNASWPLLELWASNGVKGGAVYDAQILKCAQVAGASRLATLNRRHFERFDLGGLKLLVP